MRSWGEETEEEEVEVVDTDESNETDEELLFEEIKRSSKGVVRRGAVHAGCLYLSLIHISEHTRPY